jgi:hypothetical protein
MATKTFLVCVVLLTTSLSNQPAHSQAIRQPSNNPYFGTWMENTKKSTYAAGMKPPLLNVHKWEPWDQDGMKCSILIVDADGKESRSAYYLKFDGNYYPVVGEEGRDAISSRRIDAYTFVNSSRKQGKGGEAGGRQVFSQDGKTITLVNGQGRAGRVYDKLF